MRFIQFLLNEKITQKELKDVFKNDNVYIGAEFEFIHYDVQNEIEGGGNIQQEYESAQADWESWSREMEEWQREYEEINSNISNLEESIFDLESDIEDLENDKRELEEEIRRSYDSEEDEETRQKIESIQNAIDNKTKELDRLLDEKRDYESDLELHQQDGVPEPGMDYINYMENYENVNFNVLDPTDLPEPREPGESSIDEREWLDIAERELPDSIRSAMFIEDYEIGGYDDIEQNKENQTWAFEYDSSVSDRGGVEMKSPPMPLPDFMDILPDILDWITDHGTTDNYCGLHFHMSLDNTNNLQASIDMVKLLLFSEEEYIYKFFPNRIDNSYAQEIKNKIVSTGPSQIQSYVKELFGKKKISPEDASDVLGSHYDAIHKVADNKNLTHVEFRHLGGNNYHKKEKEITSLIGKYAMTLSIACDSNYKYKEYVSKLTRIINKIDKVSLVERYETLKDLYDQVKGDNDKQLEKLKKVFDDEPFVNVTEDHVNILKGLIKQRLKELKQQISNIGVNISSKEKHAITRRLYISNMVEEERDKIREKLRKRSR